MFGRKRKGEDVDAASVPAEVSAATLEEIEDAPGESDAEPSDEIDAEPTEADEADADEGDAPEAAELAEVDWRAEGPFDFDEVDLGHSEVSRIDLGSLIVTPWDGLGVQLQVDEATRVVQAITCVWEESGLEVALFAAPVSGGLAHDLREELIEEAQAAGGKVGVEEGPFGPQLKRVVPQPGPKGEQLFHVSQVWFAEGPRWLLRGTLLGEAALAEPGDPKAAPFVEFFRNLVVRRGGKPMVPGEVIGLKLPEGVQ
jgi:hypothetical protein